MVLTIGDTEFEDRVPISSTRWRGGILFDDWARSVFRGQTAAVQSAASTVSDYIFVGGSLVPLIVDNYFVTLDVHQNADVAVQMLVMNMESLGFSGLLSLSAEHFVGRARPYVQDCRQRPRVLAPPGSCCRTRAAAPTTTAASSAVTWPP